MHGRKKSELPRTKEEIDAVQDKIRNYKKVINAVRHKRASGDLDGEYRSLLGKVLRLHPDYYSIWNFRKEAVLHELDRISEGERDDKCGRVFKEELALSVDCIRKNPKSYPAWHHHKWALEKGLDFLGGSRALEEVLGLCSDFLELDGRNFHCWAHRMWVAERMGLPAEDDFAFTTSKIMQNFSNYSAFHYRSKLLPRMVTEAGRERWQLLAEELDLAHDAMFTEPADQSAWWYHHFLLSWAGDAEDTEDLERYANVLRAEMDILRELIEVEGRCKWAELTLLLVTQRLADSLAKKRLQEVNGSDERTRRTVMELRSSSTKMASELLQLDPIHARFYAFLQRGGTLRPSPEGMRVDELPAADDAQVM